MQVTVVDPPAYTPPYDHALCAALAQRGLDVELATSRFRYGPAPVTQGYRRSECFYRWAPGSLALRAAQHPLDMLRLARRLRARGGLVHFQWLPIPSLDRRLVRRFPHPCLLTAHDLLPREAGAAQRAKARALFDEVEAVVVHSRASRARLVQELAVDEPKVHVIPHGVFDYLANQDHARQIDPGVGDLEGRTVVLFFGLLRPYKGIDLLIEAFADTPEEAVLLVVGMPRMPVEPLRTRAAELSLAERVRFVPRFVTDVEISSYFRRADLVVLPYRESEQSGVLSTALAFGSPLLITDVGGFGEVGRERGAARVVPPNDVEALHTALAELIVNDGERARLAEAARRAATDFYSWSRAAELTEALYRSLLEQ